jgi:hypothetical protein
MEAIIQELISILKTQQIQQDNILNQFKVSNQSLQKNADLTNAMNAVITQLNQNMAALKNGISQNSEQFKEYLQHQLEYEEDLANKEEQKLELRTVQENKNKFLGYERVAFLLLIAILLSFFYFGTLKSKAVESQISDAEIKYHLLETGKKHGNVELVLNQTEEYFKKMGRDSALRFIQGNNK